MDGEELTAEDVKDLGGVDGAAGDGEPGTPSPSAPATPVLAGQPPVVKNGPEVLDQLMKAELGGSQTDPAGGLEPSEPVPAELAEIEGMVMADLKKPAGPTPTAPSTTTPVEIKINWSTHKKEGMRLSRMMDSQAEAFPHMMKLWSGSTKDCFKNIVFVCSN